MTVVVWLYSKGNGEVMSKIIESASLKKIGILHFFTFGHCILYGPGMLVKQTAYLLITLFVHAFCL